MQPREQALQELLCCNLRKCVRLRRVRHVGAEVRMVEASVASRPRHCKRAPHVKACGVKHRCALLDAFHLTSSGPRHVDVGEVLNMDRGGVKMLLFCSVGRW